MSESPPRVGLNAVFDLLSDDYRRYVLYYLNENGDAPIEELATYIRERESGEAVDDDALHGLVVQLHHNHLPRLDDAGMVDYEEGRMRARLGPNATDLSPLFDAAKEIDDPAASES